MESPYIDYHLCVLVGHVLEGNSVYRLSNILVFLHGLVGPNP